MTRKRRRAVAVMLLIAVMICSSLSTAAAVKRSVKTQVFTTKTRVAQNRATTVTRGTTLLTFNAGRGYIRFQAPATKTYTFTFCNIKDSGRHSVMSIAVQKPNKGDKSHLNLVDVRTQGGKDCFLSMASNGYRDKYGKGTNKYLTSRTCKVLLQKGQVLYFHFGTWKTKHTATLKIN